MPRIMTWNCRGAEERDKWNQIVNYKTAKSIDAVFLQEGTSLYVNNTNISDEICTDPLPSGHMGQRQRLGIKLKSHRVADRSTCVEGLQQPSAP
jgi:hypothetical protein